MTEKANEKDRDSGLTAAAQSWLQQRVQRALAGGDKSQTIPRRTSGEAISLSAAQK